MVLKSKLLQSKKKNSGRASPDISWIAKVITPCWCVRSVLATGIPGYS